MDNVQQIPSTSSLTSTSENPIKPLLISSTNKEIIIEKDEECIENLPVTEEDPSTLVLPPFLSLDFLSGHPQRVTLMNTECWISKKGENIECPFHLTFYYLHYFLNATASIKNLAGQPVRRVRMPVLRLSASYFHENNQKSSKSDNHHHNFNNTEKIIILPSDIVHMESIRTNSTTMGGIPNNSNNKKPISSNTFVSPTATLLIVPAQGTNNNVLYIRYNYSKNVKTGKSTTPERWNSMVQQIVFSFKRFDTFSHRTFPSSSGSEIGSEEMGTTVKDIESKLLDSLVKLSEGVEGTDDQKLLHKNETNITTPNSANISNNSETGIRNRSSPTVTIPSSAKSNFQSSTKLSLGRSATIITDVPKRKNYMDGRFKNKDEQYPDEPIRRNSYLPITEESTSVPSEASNFIPSSSSYNSSSSAAVYYYPHMSNPVVGYPSIGNTVSINPPVSYIMTNSTTNNSSMNNPIPQSVPGNISNEQIFSSSYEGQIYDNGSGNYNIIPSTMVYGSSYPVPGITYDRMYNPADHTTTTPVSPLSHNASLVPSVPYTVHYTPSQPSSYISSYNSPVQYSYQPVEPIMMTNVNTGSPHYPFSYAMYSSPINSTGNVPQPMVTKYMYVNGSLVPVFTPPNNGSVE